MGKSSKNLSRDKTTLEQKQKLDERRDAREIQAYRTEIAELKGRLVASQQSKDKGGGSGAVDAGSVKLLQQDLKKEKNESARARAELQSVAVERDQLREQVRDLELTIGLDKRVRALTVDLKESERRREVLLADLAASQSEVELYHQRLQQLEADVSKRIYLASQQADINLSDLQRRHDKLRMEHDDLQLKARERDQALKESSEALVTSAARNSKSEDELRTSWRRIKELEQEAKSEAEAHEEAIRKSELRLHQSARKAAVSIGERDSMSDKLERVEVQMAILVEEKAASEKQVVEAQAAKEQARHQAQEEIKRLQASKAEISNQNADLSDRIAQHSSRIKTLQMENRALQAKNEAMQRAGTRSAYLHRAELLAAEKKVEGSTSDVVTITSSLNLSSNDLSDLKDEEKRKALAKMLDGRSIIELVQSYLPGATSLKKQFDELAQEKQALLGQLAAHKPSSEDDVAAATQTDASPIPDLVDTSTQTALSFFHYLDLQESAMSARQQLEREEERVAELQKRVEGFEAAAADRPVWTPAPSNAESPTAVASRSVTLVTKLSRTITQLNQESKTMHAGMLQLRAENLELLLKLEGVGE